MKNQFTDELENTFNKIVIANKLNRDAIELESFPREKGGVYLAVRMNPTGSSHMILGVGSTNDFKYIKLNSELVDWLKLEGITHVIFIICEQMYDANDIEFKILKTHKHAKQLNTGASYRL